ncbi:MAG: hypothetical protein J7513_10055 [Solirubrobacteraceae bacterium]|nr:hypothetical protein [Solirubrobacteraceae bacterium]
MTETPLSHRRRATPCKRVLAGLGAAALAAGVCVGSVILLLGGATAVDPSCAEDPPGALEALAFVGAGAGLGLMVSFGLGFAMVATRGRGLRGRSWQVAPLIFVVLAVVPMAATTVISYEAPAEMNCLDS